MKQMIAIAFNTLREAIRDKILYSLLFFAAVMVVLSLVLGEWSVLERDKVILDFCLGAASFFGLVISITVGIVLWHKEFARKTVYLMTTKPLSRTQFLLGKYIGLVLTLLLCLLSMFLLIVVMALVTKVALPSVLWQAFYGLYLEMILMAALALLFASFSTPFLSAFFTMGMYIIGHLTGDLINHLDLIAKHGKMIPGALSLPSWLESVVRGLYWVLPNLSALNLRGEVVYEQGVSIAYLLVSTGHVACYTIICLAIASWWFSLRDL